MRKWIIILVIIIIAAIFGYNYIYQDHRDIEKETAEFSITSSEIAARFSENSTEAEKTFLNKTIEISGAVSEISLNDLTIDDKAFCQFSSEIKETIIKVNSKIKVKGRVIGYDDLLEQVKLDQCVILE
ncbi:OB-fold protein [Winogradskyella sp. R77965]|uniref:OB-fold protein n=1 Tax=Winogradskyella sp. R77965 TaxID=3093872 RepID=UPI0037DD73E1